MGKTKRNARGGGSISKRKDGRWCGRYTVVLPNGQHKVRSVYGKTQSEAREKLAQCIARRDRGEITMGTGMTVEKFYEIWMSEIVDNYLRDTTIEQYERVFGKYILPILGKKNLNTLDVGDVERCFNLAKKCSKYQAHNMKKALSSMLSKAYERKYILSNPARDFHVKRPKNKKPAIWNKHQLRQFLAEAKKSSPYYLAYAMMANYGLRRGEALGIRWKDIDFENDCIHIQQQVVSIDNKPKIGELKTEESLRDLPLNEWIVAIIRTTPVKGFSGLIMQTKNGTPIAPRNFYRDFRKIVKKANLPHIKIHAFRYMAACFMRDEGVDPKTCQCILGHATLDMTVGVYQLGNNECEKNASIKMSEMLRGC